RFASGREADRYRQLLLMETAGEIADLALQPKFPFEINGRPVLIKSNGYPNGRRASYTADFKYRDSKHGWREVVEDAKGADTSASRLRRAIVTAQYGIEIVLI
ncbi:MAG: DUF1064 domain-containing protein, partial [Hyphomicrobiaceae bacterium]|nr:DUF1064 domain-containing protein [Hyphomicrobiaceae bacterium]